MVTVAGYGRFCIVFQDGYEGTKTVGPDHDPEPSNYVLM